MIGRDDDAGDIRDGVFVQMLLVDAQHVRWRSDISLTMVVELKAVASPRSRASLTRSITDFRKPLNRASMCCGETSTKFHGPIACLTGSSAVSLPMPCAPPRTRSVIYLFKRALHAMRQPLDNVLSVITEDTMQVVDPRDRLYRRRRA